MSRNATASWSGYSHQGKIGFLIALRKIRALNSTGLGDYHIEYETQEDIKLIQAGNVIEVHQVKAFNKGQTIGAYTEALEVFEGCAGQNCLHTIRHITNWENLTAEQNPANVARYAYSGDRDYCPLNAIEQYILEEIGQILHQCHHGQWNNTGWQKDAFLEYLGLLDDRIRYEHMTKTQDEYEVRITLTEILASLLEPPNRKRLVTLAIRQEIYQQYVDFIEWLETDLDSQIPAEHEAFVRDIIQRICLLGDKDLENFLNQIFPFSTQGKTLGTTSLTHDFFVSTAFLSPFLQTLISVQNTPLTLEGGTYPHYRSAFNYLLTAIQLPDTLKVQVAQKILIHEKLNQARYETHFIITEHYSGRLNDIASRIVAKDRSILAPNDLVFVTKQTAIDKLN